MVVKNYPLISWVVLLVFLVIFFWYFLYSSTTPSSKKLSGIENCRDVNRSPYPFPLETFDFLPSPPACLLSVSTAFSSKQYSDVSFFSPEYFLQPEFYPSFFEEGIPKWINPMSSHFGVVGFGAFPSQQTMGVSPGKTYHGRIFWHSGFGVRGFQGGKLVVSFADPSDENKLNVRLDANAQKGVILGPTFPQFNPLWVHPVDVFVSFPENMVPSTVSFWLVSENPESSFSDFAREKYGALYHEVTEFVGSRPVAQITVYPAP